MKHRVPGLKSERLGRRDGRSYEDTGAPDGRLTKTPVPGGVEGGSFIED